MLAAQNPHGRYHKGYDKAKYNTMHTKKNKHCITNDKTLRKAKIDNQRHNMKSVNTIFLISWLIHTVSKRNINFHILCL